MSDIQALYETLAEYEVPNQHNKEVVIFEGTFRERLVQFLEGYKRKQMEKVFLKGNKLYQMMLAHGKSAAHVIGPAHESAQSKFSHTKSLEDNGYIEDITPYSSQLLLCMRIGLVLDMIGQNSDFSMDSGNNSIVCHNLVMPKRKESGGYYIPTDAIFMQIINPTDGIIVAYDNLSPCEANKLASRLCDLDIPTLQHWSDVAFLQWKSKATKDSKLQFVLRYNVLNIITESVVKSIHTANATETSPWPGISYDALSLEGQALLGTPNGSSVAYMLIQHREDLGHRAVDKITVFQNSSELMLLFHIVDVDV